MPHKSVTSKEFTWHHFSSLKEADFTFMHKEFKFHPLDFDDLREGAELPKVDVYKDYVFAVFVIPVFDKIRNRVGKKNLAVFIGKGYIVTATPDKLKAVDRLFERTKRSNGLKKEILAKSPGFFLYKLLDYVFRDVNVILQELVKETHDMEDLVYEKITEVATKRLGILRSNILFFNHLIDPQRNLLAHLIGARKSFLGKDLEVYFDDVKDTLDGQWVVSNNLRNMVDSLFSVNEAFLTHRTNAIIRILTVISVVLMPPTLITSFYGMNVVGLPYADNILMVSLIVLTSIVGFLAVIIYLDKSRR